MVDRWGRLNTHRGIWAGGDAREGNPGAVTSAVDDGRRAALAMAGLIADQEPPKEQSHQTIIYEQLNLNYFEHPAPEHQPGFSSLGP
jgi:hypothetical protein